MGTGDDTPRQGGCLCGRLRYRLTGPPIWTANCHCASCRRATGAAMATYAGFATDQFSVTRGSLAEYAPTDGVRRAFCADCGTSISYSGWRWPGEIHIHIGSLDDPEALPPKGNAFEEQKLSWLRFAHDNAFPAREDGQAET